MCHAHLLLKFFHEIIEVLLYFKLLEEKGEYLGEIVIFFIIMLRYNAMSSNQYRANPQTKQSRFQPLDKSALNKYQNKINIGTVILCRNVAIVVLGEVYKATSSSASVSISEK